MTTTDKEIRYLPATEVRFAEGEKRVSGYAAVFNSFSEDLGGFREIIRPGAFGKSLAAGADVRLLINHDGLPLARTKSGTLRLAEDQKGLRFEADLDLSDPDAQRVAPKLKRGDLDQMSFAFRVQSDIWRTENGQPIRELHAVDISDVSLVTYPAYPATQAALRSLDAWKKQSDGMDTATAHRLLRLAEAGS